MSYEDASNNPYVLSVKREDRQFVSNSNDVLEGEGTFSTEQIQEDETLIAMTELYLGGMVGLCKCGCLGRGKLSFCFFLI